MLKAKYYSETELFQYIADNGFSDEEINEFINFISYSDFYSVKEMIEDALDDRVYHSDDIEENRAIITQLGGIISFLKEQNLYDVWLVND